MYDTSYERIHGSSSLFLYRFGSWGSMLLSLPSMPGVTKGTTPVHRPVNMNCQAVLGTLIQRPSRWGGVSCSSGARRLSRAHRTRALSDVTLLACQSVRGIQALCHQVWTALGRGGPGTRRARQNRDKGQIFITETETTD